MHFAHDAKKLKFLLLSLLLAALLFALPALAEEPINFTLSVEPDSLTAPGPVTVSVRVVNEGDADMTEPVLLYDPDGNIVSSFGDGGQALLKKGEFVTAQQTYNVTQAQLDEGKLTYMLTYNQLDNDGQVIVQSQVKSVPLAFTGTKVDLTVNRTIDPEVVRNGSTVTVQYELYNAGNVEITNIRVRENSSVSGTAQTIASLAPGARETIKFTATMNSRDLTSEGKVTYKAGSESRAVDLPAVTIPRANPGLELENILSADKTSIENGDTVTLTLSIKNNGNITYSNISVTDAKYGELFTNLTLAPGETLTREKQFTLSETTAFKYTVTLPDNTGTTNTVTSQEVKVSVYDPGQVMHLSVTAAASSNTMPRIPADVDFTVTVTNNSSFEAKNITLSHGAVSFYTINSLKPSESVTVTRSFTLSQAGKFRFTASAKDALDNTVTFDSNELTITYAAPTDAPTVAPRPTVAPLVTLTAAPIEVLEPVTIQTSQVLRTAAAVVGILFGVSFILFAFSTIVRAKRRSVSKNAYDHMELGGKRNYTEPAQDAPAPEAEATEAESLAFVKPSDEILRESAASTPVMPSHNSDNGSYRLTRDDGAAILPEQTETQPEAAAEEPAEKAPRRRRSQHKNVPDEDE